MRPFLFTLLLPALLAAPAAFAQRHNVSDSPLCAGRYSQFMTDDLCWAPGRNAGADHILHWKPMVMDATCCVSGHINPFKTDRAHAQGALELLFHSEDPHYHMGGESRPSSADITARHRAVMQRLQALPLPPAPALHNFRDKRVARHERLYRLNLAEAQARERNSYTVLTAHPDVQTLCTQEYARMRDSGAARDTLGDDAGVSSPWQDWRRCMLDAYKDYPTHAEESAAYDAFHALFSRVDQECVSGRGHKGASASETVVARVNRCTGQ